MTCTAKLAGCTGRGTERHHIKLRSRGGSDRPANLMAVCLSCHRHIHANPYESHKLGFMRHSWEEEPDE